MSTGDTGDTGDIIRREHDYNLNELKLVDYTGKAYDFTAHFIEFTYEESVFSSPHGTLIAIDAVDYPTLLPMIGEEKLIASFTRQDENNPGDLLPSITFEMPIYSLDGRHQDQGSSKRQVYNLRYISPEVLKAVKTKVFKAYKGKLYSDMVQEIYDQKIKINKPIVIEPTQFEMDYVIRNERPFGSIKEICKRSISAEGNGSFYTFYEDRDQFYFISLGKLITQAPKHTFRYEVKNVRDNPGGVQHSDQPIERDLYNAQNLNLGEGFDVLSNAMSGEATSRLLSINPIRRKSIIKDFDLRQEFDSFKHLEKNKRWTDNNPMFGDPASNMKMVVSNVGNDVATYIASHEPGIKPYFYEEYKLRRPSEKQQLSKQIVKISLSGDPRVKAGDVIQFLVPELLGKVSEEFPEELDRYLQGKYLISAVCHIVKHGSYTMNLELIKDTYFKEIQNRDPVEIYKDVY